MRQWFWRGQQLDAGLLQQARQRGPAAADLEHQLAITDEFSRHALRARSQDKTHCANKDQPHRGIIFAHDGRGNVRPCGCRVDLGQLCPTMRALLLNLLPKVLLSRLTGLLASIPLPRALRVPFFRWFARRYGADLGQVAAPLASFRSLQAFFRRELRPGSRPVGTTQLVWPCDGRIVTAGPIANGRILQVKGRDYSLADLLADADLARALEGGTQATVYLAPGDYHRVHAPFAGEVRRVIAVPGTLFPVNSPAVACIRDLFARNSRHVFDCQLTDGRRAAVVMVGAFNVGGTIVTAAKGTRIECGSELGQFGFGSTAIAIVARGGTQFSDAAPALRVWAGTAAC